MTPQDPSEAAGATPDAVSISFSKDILPLFRSQDISCMKPRGVKLDDFDYMSDPAGDDTYPDHANAHAVYDHLTGTVQPRMPLGGHYWTQVQLDLYNNWMTVEPTYQP
jgi:hypothetical protein